MNARHIPNALTIARMVMIAPLVVAIQGGHFTVAVFLFGVAGFSDGLDGYLARRFDWRTHLGSIIDPVADKLLMVSVFAVLAASGLVPVWLAALVIGRDVVIVAGAAAYRVLIGPFEGAARVASKLNTALQLLFVLCVLTHSAFDLPARPAIVMLGAAVMVSSIVSGLDYIRYGTALAWQSRSGSQQ